MKIYVQYREGDDTAGHWRQQVTLPKKWLASPCDRLKIFLTSSYNKAHPDSPQLVSEEWHLCNEGEGWCEPLGSENLISDMLDEYDDVFLRPGPSDELTAWRRANSKPASIASAAVLVPTEHEDLLALRAAVDADDPDALKDAVERANIASPHEMLMSETDVRDADNRIIGTEWHSVAGRFAWNTDEEGRGEMPGTKMTLAEYARSRKADRVLKLLDIADHCGAPVVGGRRDRSAADIEASAASVADKVGEMNAQLRASLAGKGGS